MSAVLESHFQKVAKMLVYAKKARREFVPMKLRMAALNPHCQTNYGVELRALCTRLEADERKALMHPGRCQTARFLNTWWTGARNGS